MAFGDRVEVGAGEHERIDGRFGVLWSEYALCSKILSRISTGQPSIIIEWVVRVLYWYGVGVGETRFKVPVSHVFQADAHRA